jgi:Rrf2 family iron-sulfur cluster assembly transcriptional regulator
LLHARDQVEEVWFRDCITDHRIAQGEAEPVALAEIAARQEISQSYLEQLFGRLRRAGLVRSARGPGGGYRLARPAAELWIADIVVAVDENLRATRCPPNSGKGCMKDAKRCVTHDLWEELGIHIHHFLDSVSLEDVCARRVIGTSGRLTGGDPGLMGQAAE